MKKSKYEWGIVSLAKGIDPDAAIKEMERIENVYGSLTPEHVLEASKDAKAILHNIFLWDNKAAAHQYRLQQARGLINNIEIIVISDGEETTLPVYEVVKRNEGRVYKHINEFTQEDIEEVKMRTLKELNALRQKISLYKQFHPAVQKMDEASNIIAQA